MDAVSAPTISITASRIYRSYLPFFCPAVPIKVEAYLCCRHFFVNKLLSSCRLQNAMYAADSLRMYSTFVTFCHLGTMIPSQWKYDSQIVVFDYSMHFESNPSRYGLSVKALTNIRKNSGTYVLHRCPLPDAISLT